MSPLTKIFVVLLVVVSMLQTAATVVFVHKIAPMSKDLDTAKSQVTTEQAKAAAAQSAQAKAETQIKALSAEAEDNKKTLTAVIGQMQSTVSSLQTQLASASADKAARDQQIAALTQQITWAVAAETKFAEQVKALQVKDDKLVAQQEGDSKTIADLTSQTDTMKAHLDDATEQLASAKDSNEKLQQYIKSHGLQMPGADFVPTGASQLPINGKVTEKQNINGLTYVSLNVGSADGVQVGTNFNILDRDGHFLGSVKVEHVDQNISTGKFTGEADKVSQLQASDDAMTRLRS